MFFFFKINVKLDVEKIQQVDKKHLILVLTFGIFSEIQRYSTKKNIELDRQLTCKNKQLKICCSAIFRIVFL